MIDDKRKRAQMADLAMDVVHARTAAEALQAADEMKRVARGESTSFTKEEVDQLYTALKKLHGRLAVWAADSIYEDQRDTVAFGLAVKAVKLLGREWGANEYD